MALPNGITMQCKTQSDGKGPWVLSKIQPTSHSHTHWRSKACCDNYDQVMIVIECKLVPRFTISDMMWCDCVCVYVRFNAFCVVVLHVANISTTFTKIYGALLIDNREQLWGHFSKDAAFPHTQEKKECVLQTWMLIRNFWGDCNEYRTQ